MATRPKRLRAASRLGVSLSIACGACVSSDAALAATEVDRDAYWIESAVCTVAIRTAAGAGVAEAGNALGALTTAPANCTGNQMAQVVPGGVHTLLQRGFRITTAHHQIVTLPARADGEVAMLVTGLFALERPAIKPPPIPK
jgi:hypothetical protein